MVNSVLLLTNVSTIRKLLSPDSLLPVSWKILNQPIFSDSGSFLSSDTGDTVLFYKKIMYDHCFIEGSIILNDGTKVSDTVCINIAPVPNHLHLSIELSIPDINNFNALRIDQTIDTLDFPSNLSSFSVYAIIRDNSGAFVCKSLLPQWIIESGLDDTWKVSSGEHSSSQCIIYKGNEHSISRLICISKDQTDTILFDTILIHINYAAVFAQPLPDKFLYMQKSPLLYDLSGRVLQPPAINSYFSPSSGVFISKKSDF